MAVEPQGRNDGDRPPFRVEDDPILANVKIERPARDASPGKCVVRVVELGHNVWRRTWRRLVPSIAKPLDLLIS